MGDYSKTTLTTNHMAQTVIGIFDDASEAQTAMQELMEAGFSRNNIDLSTQNPSDATANVSAEYRTDDDHNHEKKGGIMGFFASLFGDDDDDRDRYSTVGERHSILTVHAQSEDEAERVADILDDAGAIDVNERAEQYRSGLTTGVSADPLNPIYGNTPHVTSDSTNYDNTDSTNRDSAMNAPAGTDWNSTTGTHQQDMGQQSGMGDRGNRNRSRIFDGSVDETNRLREDRSWNNNESMKRPDADVDAENMVNTNPGYNRTVDPESDVTKR